MQTPTCQVAITVIGAGTAGQAAFKRVLKTHDQVLVINSGIWTTTCATVGCMPSKLLIAAAERASIAQYSAEFGVTGGITIDGKAVMARVRRERDYFTQFITKEVENWDKQKTIDGVAHIVGKDEQERILIAVNDELVATQQLIIATGSTPIVLDEWADANERILTSDSIFEQNDLPKRLAVIGTGAIGLELAQAMAKLGVEVTIFNRQAKIAGIVDETLNSVAIDVLANNPTTPNLTMHLNTQIKALYLTDDSQQITVNYQDSTGSHQYTADYVLLAIGRKTHLAKLGVEKIGIALDKRGNPINIDPTTGKIHNSPVFIIGDANGITPLMHIASDEGYNAGNIASNLIDNRVERLPDTGSTYIPVNRVFMAVTFTHPNIAQVGYNLTQLNEAKANGKLDFVVGMVSFARQGRSRIMGVNAGQLHIYADKHTGKILGSAMIAPDGEYLAHILALAIEQNMTVEALLRMPFYHPTIVEGLRTALQNTKHLVQNSPTLLSISKVLP